MKEQYAHVGERGGSSRSMWEREGAVGLCGIDEEEVDLCRRGREQ